MIANFSTLHNNQEERVRAEVLRVAGLHPRVAANPDFLVDVACVALNNLPPRYIRHSIDLSFYMTESDLHETEAAVRVAVEKAYAFIDAKIETRSQR